ncbi:unnamed protein product [Plutella xylostella]|uniref:(diamondback moth) hypothetical protein n=1 Tax=Plutella xylostella TaxID=51655 RepID=A0A8S4G3A7_PLUXY|nr:unnamed protein product [Plutella xylostella]
MAAILPAGLRNQVKGLDANRYATKKTVAQGMLDIALLTSNASQLKYVLQVGPRHEFYTLLVVLISISIVLQVCMGLVLLSLNLLRDCRLHDSRHHASAVFINYGTTGAAAAVTMLNLLVGLLFVIIGGLDLNDHADQPSALVLNDIIVIFIFVISVINIVNSAFGIEYSNSPLVLERLNASAGVLALTITFLDSEDSENTQKKKVANWLYHISVAMMTGVVFCDVLKMTFGLDPALSMKDLLGNNTSIVQLILGTIFNINHHPDQRKADILNNVSLIFKVISITLNIIISVFYSIQVDHFTFSDYKMYNNNSTADDVSLLS